MLIAIIWVVLAVVVGVAAHERGRSGFSWFLVAVIISPLIAGILLVIFPDLRTHALLEDIRNASSVDDRALSRNLEGRFDGFPADTARSDRQHGGFRVGWALLIAAIVAIALAAWILGRP